MTNRRGPKTEPWGTPSVTCDSSDLKFVSFKWMRPEKWSKLRQTGVCKSQGGIVNECILFLYCAGVHRGVCGPDRGGGVYKQCFIQSALSGTGGSGTHVRSHGKLQKQTCCSSVFTKCSALTASALPPWRCPTIWTGWCVIWQTWRCIWAAWRESVVWSTRRRRTTTDSWVRRWHKRGQS